jgi:mRNA interferase RelE/StbE
VVDISFTDAAIDDLRRIGPDAVPKVLKKLLILFTDPKAGYPLGGELTGYRKLVVGRNTWRIVYRLSESGSIEVCEVWAIGARADAEVYAEAAARVLQAAQDRPEFVRLAEVVDRLGKLADGIVIEQSVAAEPVPDWLAERLVHTAGLSREVVAAMDLQQAVDRWGAYMAQPNQ